MFRKIISLITMCALLMSVVGLAGCSKTVTIPIGEIRASSPARIVKVKPKDDDPVEFDSTGGRYIRQTIMVVGTDVNNTQQRIPLGKGDSVYYRFNRDSRLFSQNAKTFKKLRDHESPGLALEEIRGLVADNIKYDFDKSRGQYDPVHQRIHGLSRGYDTLSFSINDIDSLRVRRPDYLKTTLLVAGVGVVAIIAFIAATWDMSIDLNPPGNWPLGY